MRQWPPEIRDEELGSRWFKVGNLFLCQTGPVAIRHLRSRTHSGSRHLKVRHYVGFEDSIGFPGFLGFLRTPPNSNFQVRPRFCTRFQNSPLNERLLPHNPPYPTKPTILKISKDAQVGQCQNYMLVIAIYCTTLYYPHLSSSHMIILFTSSPVCPCLPMSAHVPRGSIWWFCVRFAGGLDS